MGKIKEVLAELDNGAEVIITEWGMSMVFETNGVDTRYNYHFTVNDIEQTMNVIRYLREMRPFETLASITGSHPHIEIPIPDLPTLNTPAVTGGKRK